MPVKKKPKDKIYVCDRCEITPTSGRGTMCPCPRGGCEAKLVSIPQKLYTRKEIYTIIDRYFQHQYLDADTEVLKNQF